jgi:hypothetical protein
MSSLAKIKTAPFVVTGDVQPGAYAVATPANPIATTTTTTTTSSVQQYSDMARQSSFNTEATAVISQPPEAVKDRITCYNHTEQPSVVKAYQYVFIESREPVVLTYCPKCYEENVTTRTHTKSNGITVLCVVAGVVIFWPLCWLPLCIKPMKQTNHCCTKCGCKVGRVKPFQ